MVVLLAAMPSDTSAHSGHPQKSLFVDKWYQLLSDSGSYASWMTLTGHRHFSSSSIQSLWATPVSTAHDGYNLESNPGGTHTVLITNYVPAFWHDVHTWATQDGCWTDLDSNKDGVADISRCTSAEGQVFLFDEAFHACPGGDCDAQHSRPNTWWYAVVALNENALQAAHGSATSSQKDFLRTGVASEELGHAIGLAHDGTSNGFCSSKLTSTNPSDILRTIMDNDCQHLFVIKIAQKWDSCGINHKYDDPKWGFAGC